MRPKPERHRLPLWPLLAALATPIAAQAPIEFRTPDGSRVVLLPDQGPPLVHWAVATPCGPQVDPPSVPGLAAAAAEASLRGTWTIGSRDAARERAVLQQLDAAETDLQVAPRSGGSAPTDLQAAVDRLRAEADGLADSMAFRRVLAASPVTDLQLDSDLDTTVLALTTTPPAVANVARLLLERREQQALRGVRDDLRRRTDELAAAWDQQPLAPLYAEVLALAFPGHPLARAGERPAAASGPRELALATWQRAQHPRNTVHVLTGNFDAAAVRAALEKAFAATALPDPGPLQPAVLRPLPALRRTMIPGASFPAVLLALPLEAADGDRAAVATAARWFADGPDSWLAQELVRRGRKGARTAVRVGWPDAAASGLLVVEVTDAADGGPRLAEDVLALCAKAVPKGARPGQMPAAFGAVLRDFELATARPDLRTAWLARTALRHADEALPPPPPPTPPFPELAARLQRILDRNPIVVEWRDA